MGFEMEWLNPSQHLSTPLSKERVLNEGGTRGTMPFLGTLDGDIVLPESIEDGVTVQCPDCREVMAPRGPFQDGRARHFFHLNSDAGSCSGGESDQHRTLKSIAVSTLRLQFPDHNYCRPEVTFNTTHTDTDAGHRRADAVVEFTEPNVFWGRGVIIEVQYRNHGKDLYATTHDYLSLGFSVTGPHQMTSAPIA